ncbi:ABC transporter substrate-binding protein [Deinococcus metallilatus]|uniref:ABC transporter substrate-binding protein n=1 Tax=Deinococcus metallilatus TaxID=1211322 RepID=A0AAJ5F0K7_9DEIO|nr:ABC transporter substrate-binding protein [Deinococcus metallilatus]MBB5297445.1 sn-glycerol 3-phosphate transport system substrate-binding protein [Deinococcus metallilatus]QBY08333.1 ABC transporter substrate-binding protein [Deinococcus metallilatus]RXJ11436.1 ABC transporter substrate-binding protein [Deinococcus metallilatus]TLK20617.1 ABC transporter substrate-binding protein [Deinococcus metallilatus]GMA17002.1 ABC transporter substrate-binding protein [Deinococcus metallilatus]
MRRLLLPLSLLLGTLAQAEPVRIEFWHAMDGVQGTVAGYAQAFNRSQSQYEVVPRSLGNYRDLLPQLQAALKAGNAPALVQVEFTQFPRLVADGQLTDLSRLTDALPADLPRDLYAPVWRAGEVGGKRYGLPWNVSVPVLLYNAGALRRAGASVPQTWAELEAVSRSLAVNGRRPLVAAADAWTFEANVTSRGGSLVVNGRPNLNGPEAVEALTQLARMSAAGLAQPRRLSEATRAAFDFARGQNLFVPASVANWTDARKLPFFQLGIAPFPCEKAGACTVPLGGANLAVPRGATPAQQAGAVAFWQFLMDPARLADWVKTTAYAPPRRSVTPLLNDWYAKNPQLKAAHAQLDRAVPRPTAPAYGEWTAYLEDAIAQATTGKLSAKAALDEAQRRAEGR